MSEGLFSINDCKAASSDVEMSCKGLYFEYDIYSIYRDPRIRPSEARP